MKNDKLSLVVVDAIEKHTATVIWLHGLGDSGAGFYFLTEELARKSPFVKWILPNAPLREITSFGEGNVFNAWFDVHSFDKKTHLQQIDEQGMLHSVQLVEEIIQNEITTFGIPAERIILGGFSQGCVISLLTAVSTLYNLAGVVACSGWLPLGEKLDQFGSELNKKIPILICHGEEDAVVAYRYGNATAKFLKKKGYNVDFKGYRYLAHATEPQEIADISHFIYTRFNNSSKL